jgi:hypothetical protein
MQHPEGVVCDVGGAHCRLLDRQVLGQVYQYVHVSVYIHRQSLVEVVLGVQQAGCQEWRCVAAVNLQSSLKSWNQGWPGVVTHEPPHTHHTRPSATTGRCLQKQTKPYLLSVVVAC